MEMIEKKNKANRDLFISGVIDKEISDKIILQLKEINEEDLLIYEQNQFRNKENQIPYEPINITINSQGGSISCGCAIMNALEDCLAPILTHALGEVVSMAVYIYIMGDVRTAGNLSFFGIHGAQTVCGGYTEEMQKYLNINDRIVKKLDDILIERTNVTDEDIEKSKTCFTFYDYDEALQKGLVTIDIYNDDLEEVTKMIQNQLYEK